MPTLLITGANRGLGLEFVRQYAAAGWRVHAACRDPEAARDLKAVSGDVRVYRLDVTDPDQVAGLARALAGEPLDLLINNAGIYGPRETPPGRLDFEAWERVLRVNAIAPVRVTEAVLDNLAAGRRRLVVTITSRLGSIAEADGGGSLFYRSSKAALNAAMRTLALALGPRGLVFVLIHPGWVRTDMGGPEAPLDIAASVGAMRALIERLGPAETGRFLNYDGSEIPW